jgi:hypothetical protein
MQPVLPCQFLGQDLQSCQYYRALNSVFSKIFRSFGFPPLPEPALERSEGFLRVSKVLVYQCKSV